MFAIIETGGKQYKVRAKDEIAVERLEQGVGETVAFDSVCLLADDEKMTIGKPLGKAKVRATVVAQGRMDKIVVFKKKRRKGYRRKNGHRQHQTVVRIDAILGA